VCLDGCPDHIQAIRNIKDVHYVKIHITITREILVKVITRLIPLVSDEVVRGFLIFNAGCNDGI
jgi:hypothetical protein